MSDDGSFVDRVPYSGTVPYAPIDDVDRIVGDIEVFRDNQIDALSVAIENLGNLSGSYIPSFDQITATIPGLNIPNFPDKPPLVFTPNEKWPTNNIPDPFIQANVQDFSFVEPIKPGQIDPSFDYTPGIYNSALWTELYSSVRNSLLNGGTGLTDAVYALIIDRNKEARRNVEDLARQRAYDAVGETGFDLPGGMAAAVILELEKDFTAKDLDSVNSTTIKEFELAAANTNFIKDLAAKMEEIQRTSFDNEENRLFEIAKVTKELIVSIYGQNIKIFIAQWDGVKAKLEAAKIQSESISAANDGQIKIFLGRIEAYRNEIEAIAAENKSKSDVVVAEASVYEKEVGAISTKISALVEEIKSAVAVYRVQLEEVLEKEKINLAAYASSTQLAERLAKSLANIASQSVASALGALNTSMSIGYSGSESRGYHAGVTNTMTEGHPFKEE